MYEFEFRILKLKLRFKRRNVSFFYVEEHFRKLYSTGTVYLQYSGRCRGTYIITLTEYKTLANGTNTNPTPLTTDSFRFYGIKLYLNKIETPKRFSYYLLGTLENCT